MSRPKRANGAGAVYIKHGSYYGRWVTPTGRTNQCLGPVRKPGTATGLTRTQAEKRLRELMAEVTAPIARDPERTIAVAGRAFVEALEVKGRSRSHIETVESHLRVHLEPCFADRAIDRVREADVTRLLARLRRDGRRPKTLRNILSTLHSVIELAVRRDWATANPCKLVDVPEVEPSHEIRYLSQPELATLLAQGIADDEWGVLERPLYLMAAMTGLRQGELLGLRWLDLDAEAHKVRVRRAWVRGEFKPPKSRRGSRGVPLAEELATALVELAVRSEYTAEDDLVFAHPLMGRPLDRSKVRKRFQRACRRSGVRVVRFHDLRHTFVVASGSGPNCHGYWPLMSPLPPCQAEAGNLRLVHALGADRNCFDAGAHPPAARYLEPQAPAAAAGWGAASRAQPAIRR